MDGYELNELVHHRHTSSKNKGSSEMVEPSSPSSTKLTASSKNNTIITQQQDFQRKQGFVFLSTISQLVVGVWYKQNTSLMHMAAMQHHKLLGKKKEEDLRKDKNAIQFKLLAWIVSNYMNRVWQNDPYHSIVIVHVHGFIGCWFRSREATLNPCRLISPEWMMVISTTSIN